MLQVKVANSVNPHKTSLGRPLETVFARAESDENLFNCWSSIRGKRVWRADELKQRPGDCFPCIGECQWGAYSGWTFFPDYTWDSTKEKYKKQTRDRASDDARLFGGRAASIKPRERSRGGQYSRRQRYHRCAETNCRDLPERGCRRTSGFQFEIHCSRISNPKSSTSGSVIRNWLRETVTGRSKLISEDLLG